MTAETYSPTSWLDFEPNGLLTTLRSLIPWQKNSAIDPDVTLSGARKQYRIEGNSFVLLLKFDSPPPAWFSEVVRRCSQLLSLRSGWDSYGARSVDVESIIAALQVLLLTMRPRTPTPELVPTPRGTVQLEWHIQGIDLEIDVLSRGLYRVAFEDLRNERVGIEDLTTSNLDDLNAVLELLAERSQSNT